MHAIGGCASHGKKVPCVQDPLYGPLALVLRSHLCSPLPSQVPFKLHVIVGPSDTDSVARVVSAKAADLGAQLVVVARHSKGKLKVRWQADRAAGNREQRRVLGRGTGEGEVWVVSIPSCQVQMGIPKGACGG